MAMVVLITEFTYLGWWLATRINLQNAHRSQRAVSGSLTLPGTDPLGVVQEYAVLSQQALIVRPTPHSGVALRDALMGSPEAIVVTEETVYALVIGVTVVTFVAPHLARAGTIIPLFAEEAFAAELFFITRVTGLASIEGLALWWIRSVVAPELPGAIGVVGARGAFVPRVDTDGRVQSLIANEATDTLVVPEALFVLALFRNAESPIFGRANMAVWADIGVAKTVLATEVSVLVSYTPQARVTIFVVPAISAEPGGLVASSNEEQAGHGQQNHATVHENSSIVPEQLTSILVRQSAERKVWNTP